jgi:myo-inositol-1(or 4)-monophosphatase
MMDLPLISKRLKDLLSNVDVTSIASPDVFEDKENVKTSLDQEIDSYLQQSLPNVWHGTIISEEREINTGNVTEYFWLIDPVDGTINAISGSTDWAISVALIESSSMEPIVGVVYIPMRKELFAAVSGQGAWLNDLPLSAAAPTREARGYSTPIVSFGVPSNIPAVSEKMGNVLASIMRRGWVTRQTGSAAVDICRVARGSWNAFFEYGLMYWDIAAAILIAQEAGCHVEMSTDEPATGPQCTSTPRNVLVASPGKLGRQLANIAMIMSLQY